MTPATITLVSDALSTSLHSRRWLLVAGGVLVAIILLLVEVGHLSSEHQMRDHISVLERRVDELGAAVADYQVAVRAIQEAVRPIRHR